MPQDKPLNVNAGEPARQSTFDAAKVARADGDPDAHFEADPEQVTKVVHQEPAGGAPTEGPTDFEARGGLADAANPNVTVVPSDASVWEASPASDGDDPGGR